MRRLRLPRTVVRHPRDALEARRHVAVRVLFDDRRDVGVGRAAMRRVVFVAAVFGRIMRRRDHDAIGEAGGPSLVVAQDRMRDDWGRRVSAAIVDHDLDAVGGKHLDRTRQRRLGQSVGVYSNEQRTGEADVAAVVADRLRRRQDMVLVEGVPQRRAAMARGSEGNALGGVGRVGFARKISRDQPWHIGESGGIDRLAGSRILCSHVTSRKQCSL